MPFTDVKRGVTQIRASAGSGKTHTLTERIVSSFLSAANEAWQVDMWQQVLALTFTNKTVDDLRYNVLCKLQKKALDGNHRAELVLHSIFEQYDTFHIKTIDSLLYSIANSMAVELHFSGFPKPIVSDEEKLLLQESFEIFLQKVEQSDYALSLLQQAYTVLSRESSDAILLTHGIQNRVIELAHLINTENILQTYTADFIEAYNAVLQELRNAFSRKSCALRLQNQATIVHSILAELESPEYFYTQYQKALQNPFTKSDTHDVSKYLMKPLHSVLTKKAALTPHQYTILEEQHTELVLLAQEYMQCNAANVKEIEILGPLLLIAYEVLQIFHQRLQEEQCCSQSSLAAIVAQALMDPSFLDTLLLKMDSRIKHIFFDEFQDTSTTQWYAIQPIVLEALAKGGSFTYVGDTKQAIYGWRGGNPQLFQDIVDDIQTRQLAAIYEYTLPYNWRSAPPIVTFANIFALMEDANYAKIFLRTLIGDKKFDDIEQSYPELIDENIQKLASFYTHGTQQPSEKTFDQSGLVCISILEQQETIEKDSLEATKQELLWIIDQTIRKNYTYADIALLTRTNAEAQLLSEWLQEWGKPYTTEMTKLLKDSPLVQAIHVFFSFIACPNDTDYWSILHTKLLQSVDLQELYTWKVTVEKHMHTYIQHKKAFPHIWEQYFAPFFNKPMLYRAYDYLITMIDVFCLYDRFPEEHLTLQTLLEYMTHEKITPYTISTWLLFWKKYNATLTVSQVAPENAIQILTIHKSKGLQFPIVILPFTNGKKGNTHTKPTIHTSGELLSETLLQKYTPTIPSDIPLLASVRSEHYLKKKALLLTAIEELNALYVAYTRAQKELYVIVDNNQKTGTFASANLLKLWLDPARTIPYITYEKHTTETIQRHIIATKGYQQFPVVAYTEDRIPTAALSPTQSAPASRDSSSTRQRYTDPFSHISCIKRGTPPPLVLYRNKETAKKLTSADRGILFHTVIADVLNGISIENAMYFATLRTQYILSNVEYTALCDAITWCIDTLRTTLSIPHGKAITDCYRCITEQPFLLETGDVLRPDCIVISKEQCILLEFKTGGHNAEYTQQVQQYKTVVSAYFSMPVTALLLYFDTRTILFDV